MHDPAPTSDYNGLTLTSCHILDRKGCGQKHSSQRTGFPCTDRDQRNRGGGGGFHPRLLEGGKCACGISQTSFNASSMDLNVKTRE